MFRRLLRALAVLVVLLALSLIVAIASYQWTHAEHAYPGVTTMDGVTLGSLTRDEAASLLTQHSEGYSKREVRFRYQHNEWVAPFEALGVRSHAAQVLDSAFRVGRQGDLLRQLMDQIDAQRFGRVVDMPLLTLDENLTVAYVAGIASKIDRPVIDASLVIDTDLRVSITPSQVGRKLNAGEAVRSAVQAWASISNDPLDLPVVETPPSVAETDLESARATLSTVLSAPLTLQFEGRAWTLSRRDIASFVTLDGPESDAPPKLPVLDEDGLVKYARGLATEIDQELLRPRLEFNGGQVRVLREGRPGHKLDVDATAAAIKRQLVTNSRTLALPVRVTIPAGMSGDRLAIRELVTTATTSYAGSLPERSHNIELAASKLNGVVVGPGEIFSFNEELGPMTLQAGFKWGWGISQSGGQAVTVPSVAGGICQVSTTLFQAIFWSGYQIEERSWHLYWIDRYGQPPTGLKGLDATVDQVYDDRGNLVSAVDLKFKNTTPLPILIEAKADGGKLTFSLYSTKPTWTVNVDPPIIEEVVQTDATVVREVDPSLSPGKQIWVEAAQDGFKSTIVRTVLEDGSEPRVLRLVSTYRPSRNVVLVGPSTGEKSTP